MSHESRRRSYSEWFERVGLEQYEIPEGEDEGSISRAEGRELAPSAHVVAELIDGLIKLMEGELESLRQEEARISSELDQIRNELSYLEMEHDKITRYIDNATLGPTSLLQLIIAKNDVKREILGLRREKRELEHKLSNVKRKRRLKRDF